MKYVTYDENGFLTGAFQQEMIDAHANCYIEVDDEKYNEWASYKANSDRNGLELLPTKNPTFDQLNAQIIAKLDEIDKRTIRPLSEGEMDRVAALREEAAALRAQLIR